MAESEIERRCGFKLHDRGVERTDYRNGYRHRSVQTSFKTITLRIPRLRYQGYIPSFLEPYRRGVKQVEAWVTEAFVAGVSRAAMVRLMEETTGCRPSEGLLKRVCQRLDERARAFKERKLTGRYVYLFLDAAWSKGMVGRQAARICILTAIGITADGKREILGFMRSPRENASAWIGFLTRLKDRSLDVGQIRLVVSDEQGGILKAVPEVFGDVNHQLCWFHRCKNVREAVARRDRKAVIEGLQSIYMAPNRRAAVSAFCAFKQTWQESYSSIVASLGQDLSQLLAFYDFPELHWEYIRHPDQQPDRAAVRRAEPHAIRVRSIRGCSRVRPDGGQCLHPD